MAVDCHMFSHHHVVAAILMCCVTFVMWGVFCSVSCRVLGGVMLMCDLGPWEEVGVSLEWCLVLWDSAFRSKWPCFGTVLCDNTRIKGPRKFREMDKRVTCGSQNMSEPHILVSHCRMTLCTQKTTPNVKWPCFNPFRRSWTWVLQGHCQVQSTVFFFIGLVWYGVHWLKYWGLILKVWFFFFYIEIFHIIKERYIQCVKLVCFFLGLTNEKPKVKSHALRGLKWKVIFYTLFFTFTWEEATPFEDTRTSS